MYSILPIVLSSLAIVSAQESGSAILSSVISSVASSASSVSSVSASASSASHASSASAAAQASAAPKSPFGNASVLFATANVTGHTYGDVGATVNVYGYLNGSATHVNINVTQGLTNTSMGYLWHFHTNPIPADGNCSAALGHLDPRNITEAVYCDPAFPQYCQEGDMSGKHGKLNGSTTGAANQSFDDQYLRFFPANYSILGRSVVIHFANKTRIACGNVTSLLDGTAYAGADNTSLIATNVSSNYTTVYPTTALPNPNATVTPFLGSSTASSQVVPTGGAAIPLSQQVEINSSGGSASSTSTTIQSGAAALAVSSFAIVAACGLLLVTF